MSNALAHHGQADWLTALNSASHLLRDAVVDVLGMERHFEVQVRVGVDVATSRRNREILRELGRVPLEVSLNVAKVAHLK